MRPSARKLLVFGGKFLLSLLVLMLLWPLLGTLYNRLVVGVSALVLSVIERPPLTVLKVEGDKIMGYVHSLSLNSPTFTITREFYDLNYFGIMVLLALMFATSIGLRQQVKLTPIAVLLVLFFHAFFFLIYIRVEYIVKGVVPSNEAEFNFYLWLRLFTATGKYWFPFLIWALLTFRFWLPKPAQHKSSRAMKEARP
jgi:hypothetical protein